MFQFFKGMVWLILPAVVIISVWYPVLRKYQVSSLAVDAGMLEAARQSPDDALLREIGGYDDIFLVTDLAPMRERLPQIAEGILRGEVNIPGKQTRITFPFDPADLEQGDSSWGLAFGSFLIPRVLLAAYEQTDQQKFLEAATAVVLAWADSEKWAFLPRGFLWNDHAIAARTGVLINLWHLYRNGPTYDAERAGRILEYVSQTGQRLANPRLFTFATNHGVMQNLALLQVGLAFPALPDSDAFMKIAVERMDDQLTFYLNREGVVLEHSAGYHEAGLQFLGLYLRYLTLRGDDIPDGLRERYERAQSVYAGLRRPDGSLPHWGDTSNRAAPEVRVARFDELGRAVSLEPRRAWTPDDRFGLYPAAGLSIWSDGQNDPQDREALGQTVISWSYYPGHAHEQAGELGVLLWVDGVDWWTAVGYWPYTVPRRDQAVGWGSSNGPHLRGELPDSLRTSRVLATAWSDPLAIIELERKTDDGFMVRRQVVRTGDNAWVVLDAFSDPLLRQIRTVWRSAPTVLPAEGAAPMSYCLRAADHGTALNAFLLGDPAPGVHQVRGDGASVAGLIEHNGRVVPTSAFVLEQPSTGSWAAMVSVLAGADGCAATGQPAMRHWVGPEDWSMAIPTARGGQRLTRSGQSIALDRPGAKPVSVHLALRPAPDVGDAIEEVRQAFARVERTYGPQEKDVIRYRWRVTYALFALVALQEVFFFACRSFFIRLRWRKYGTAVRLLSLPAWSVLGAWLSLVYFQT